MAELIKDPIIEKPVDPVVMITPSFDMQGKHIATLEDGRKIIHALMTGQVMQQFRVCATNEFEKTKEGFTEIGVPQFIGYLPKDVIIAFPELDGTKVIGIDEDGKDILGPKFAHSWSGDNLTGYFVVGAEDHVEFKAIIRSTKEIDIEVIKLKSEYAVVKPWTDKMVAIKEIEDDKISN